MGSFDAKKPPSKISCLGTFKVLSHQILDHIFGTKKYIEKFVGPHMVFTCLLISSWDIFKNAPFKTLSMFCWFYQKPRVQSRKGFWNPVIVNERLSAEVHFFPNFLKYFLKRPQKPIHVAFSGFRKPFCFRTSRFRNSFQPIDIELENPAAFNKTMQTSKRYHRRPKAKSNYFNYFKAK